MDVIEKIGSLEDLQNMLRKILVNFFQRNAIYKARIQSGNRIIIPEEERKVLGLKEGDIVQVILFPVKKREEVKE